jgi:hypothetical protein
MKSSETTKGLSDALAKAQAIITNPAKDATNPHFRSKYATLDTGLNVVRDALSKHAISFTQGTRMEGDVMMLDTRLTHGNEWMESEYPVCRFPAKQQEIGSALTYARRYSLFAIVGVAGEEDDDANAATSPTSAPRKASGPSSEEQSKTILSALLSTLSAANTVAEVDKWVKDNLPTISKMLPEQKEELRSEVSQFKSELMNGVVGKEAAE